MPQGVAPPAQFRDVPAQIDRAPVIEPSGSNRMLVTPPTPLELVVDGQVPPPPTVSANVAAPSGRLRYTRLVPGTTSPPRAMIRLVNPARRVTPFASVPPNRGQLPATAHHTRADGQHPRTGTGRGGRRDD